MSSERITYPLYRKTPAGTFEVVIVADHYIEQIAMSGCTRVFASRCPHEGCPNCREVVDLLNNRGPVERSVNALRTLVEDTKRGFAEAEQVIKRYTP